MIKIITYLIGNLFWIYTLYRFNSFLYQGPKRMHKSAYFLFYLTSCSVHLIFMNPLCNMAVSILGLMLIAFCYQGNMWHRILYTILLYCLSMLCDITITACFFNYRGPKHIKSGEVALGYLLFFLLELIIERQVNIRRTDVMKAGHWMALLTIPAASMVIICLLILGGRTRISRQGIILLLLIINMLIFYLFDSIQKLYQKEARQNFMEQQLQMYAEKMEVMVQSQERLNALYHDLKYHMRTIGAMAAEAKNRNISEYLETMEMEVNSNIYHPYAANKVIDNVLNSILKNVKEQLNKLDVKVEFPEDVKSDLFDLSIVAGNLLDNAVRGALESEEKELLFYMKYEKGVLSIQAKNSMNGNVIERNGRYVTTKTKADGHGIGILNVQNIVSKYHGTMRIDHTDKDFQVHVIFYINLD